MSTQHAGSNNPTDSQNSTETIEIPVEEFEHLHERIDALERMLRADDAQERLVEYIRDLEDTVEEQEETIGRKDSIIEEQQEIIEEQQELLKDQQQVNEDFVEQIQEVIKEETGKDLDELRKEFEQYRADNERDKAKIRKFAKEQAEEGESDHSNPPPDNEENAPTEEQTPIERCYDDPDSSGVRITPSVQRAMSVVGNFREWSTKGARGTRAVTKNLRTLLGAAEDERLAWKQVYRAAEKLEELSNGALSFKKTRRHGWIVELKDDAFLTRVVSEG